MRTRKEYAKMLGKRFEVPVRAGEVDLTKETDGE